MQTFIIICPIGPLLYHSMRLYSVCLSVCLSLSRLQYSHSILMKLYTVDWNPKSKIGSSSSRSNADVMILLSLEICHIKQGNRRYQTSPAVVLPPGNVTEMEEMLDCKLDALIRSFAWEKKRFSCQHNKIVPVSRDL